MIKIKSLDGHAFELLDIEFGAKWLIVIDDCNEDADTLDVTLAPEVILKAKPLTHDIIFELGGKKVMIDTNEFKEINIT